MGRSHVSTTIGYCNFCKHSIAAYHTEPIGRFCRCLRSVCASQTSLHRREPARTPQDSECCHQDHLRTGFLQYMHWTQSSRSARQLTPPTQHERLRRQAVVKVGHTCSFPRICIGPPSETCITSGTRLWRLDSAKQPDVSMSSGQQ